MAIDLSGKTFGTRAVHAGEKLELAGGDPVVGPVHSSVGYTYRRTLELDAVLGDEQPGFVYSSRYANPTITAFEAAVANLEEAEAAHAFSSGMAAVHMALLAAGVQAGTAVVAAADVYGASYTLLRDVFSRLGAGVHMVDVLDLEAVRRTVVQEKPVALFVETISNPLMKVANLPQLADIAQAEETVFIVDNTFCSPYLCNPIRFGADMVIHSATKFISGHGDVMAGLVVTTSEWRERLLALNKLIGSSMGPFEAWLALRGLKTLPLRLRRQCDTALVLAKWLQAHPKVKHVNYPFLPDHPQYRLMHTLSGGKGAGAVLSFEITGAGREQVFAFMDALKLVQPATSLGDIYSLLLYPAISSHRSLTAAERTALGIGDGLVRLSAGIEDVADIQADIEQALMAI